MKLKEIKKVVEDVARIKDISIKTRKRHIVYYRYIYFKLAKEYTKQSLDSIGFEVRKDHAMVLHGLKMFEDVLIHDNIYFDIYKKCLKILDKSDNFQEIEHLEVTEQELKDLYNAKILQLEDKYERKYLKLKHKIDILGFNFFDNLSRLNQLEIKDLKFRMDVFFKSRLQKKGAYKTPF